MAPNDIAKTAITTPFGLFEFLRMPFGLKNSAQAFQRLMNGLFKKISFAFVYLDDILVASDSPAQHSLHLRHIFSVLQDAGLAINKKKCVFGVSSVKFLGHTVSKDGIVPLAAKVQAIVGMTRPLTTELLQRFLGCVNFYHRFVPHLAAILAPLHALVSSVATQKAPLVWTEEHVRAFSRAKSALSDAVMLSHPIPGAPLALTTDASDVAVGAVLSQGPYTSSPSPLAFFSKKLSAAEKNYSAFDKELLAVYLACLLYTSPSPRDLSTSRMPSSA